MDEPNLILDFTGIEAANGSYIRATALWMLRCALQARDSNLIQIINIDPWQIRPLKLRGVFLAGLSMEVRDDLNIQLNESRLACAEVLDWEDQIIKVNILGHLDTQLRRTLDCLLSLRHEATAEILRQHFSEDGIGTTGWNNRLSDLFQRHLIGRRKEGKFWKYFTLFKEVNDGP